MFLFLCDLVNFEALVITIAVVFGVIVLGLLVCCCCCCVRCKKTQPRWDGVDRHNTSRAPLYRSKNVVVMCASRGCVGEENNGLLWPVTKRGSRVTWPAVVEMFCGNTSRIRDAPCCAENQHAASVCSLFIFLAQSSTFSHVLARALFHPAQNWMFQPLMQPKVEHLMTIIRIG